MTEPTDDPGAQQRPDDHAAEVPRLVFRLHASDSAPRIVPPPGASTMRVVTEGAVYLFDPRTMTALRLRSEGTDLRRDGEPLALLRWPEPVVGEPLLLHLLVREDVASTVRRTSLVVRIERGSEGSSA